MYGNIGSYNKSEIIEIFGFNKENNVVFNIFTLVVFENTKQVDIEELMTEKLQPFKGYKKFSWGIKRRVVEIEVAKKLFDSLLNTNQYKIDDELLVGILNFLPEQFVQVEDSFIKPQINYLLKNNFHTGSYILEFFDEEKNYNKFLLDNPILLNDLSEQISKIIPIRLANLSDRLGNIIFQLPINSFQLQYEDIRSSSSGKYTSVSGIKIEVFPRDDKLNIKDLEYRLYEEHDHLITKQVILPIENLITEISLDDSFGTTIEIIDKRTSLLLHKKKLSPMRHMYTNMKLVENQKRVFKLNNNLEKIEVTHNSYNTYGKTKNKEFVSWIHERKYEHELQELEKKKSFIQYYGSNSEANKALEDIRYLINKYSERGVYLWDPYLNALDIKNTLYFCNKTYIPMKAITGLASTEENQKQVIKTNIYSELNHDDKQFLFMNLEVRGKIGTHGYNFHDRFLIFPLEQPKVWSLGISVNQLGKSHHILQEVKNSQHILNAFNQLWDELDHEECLVWKSN